MHKLRSGQGGGRPADEWIIAGRISGNSKHRGQDGTSAQASLALGEGGDHK
jgi:hypothetical protein